MGTEEAARRWGRDPSMIRSLCRQGRIPGAFKDESGSGRLPAQDSPPVASPRREKHSEKERREIASLAHAGANRTRLAREYGVKRLQVYRWMRAYPPEEPLPTVPPHLLRDRTAAPATWDPNTLLAPSSQVTEEPPPPLPNVAQSLEELWVCPAPNPGGARFASVRETAKRWGRAESYVAGLCAAGRVPGALRVPASKAFGRAPPGLRFVWRIPADAPKPPLLVPRLTEAQREEIARRAHEGEGRTALAREYGITPAYVHRLVHRLA